MLFCFWGAAAPAAEEPGAAFTTLLFGQACVPNLGLPDNIRAFAKQHAYAEIHDAHRLELYAGPGGAAWDVKLAAGDFVLSIDGRTQACGVWARKAEPAAVEADFRELIKFLTVPGMVARVVENSRAPGPQGVARTLAYDLGRPRAPTTLMLRVRTVERAGGVFQAALQGGVEGR